jgi:hypothetical protein
MQRGRPPGALSARHRSAVLGGMRLARYRLGSRPRICEVLETKAAGSDRAQVPFPPNERLGEHCPRLGTVTPFMLAAPQGNLLFINGKPDTCATTTQAVPGGRSRHSPLAPARQWPRTPRDASSSPASYRDRRLRRVPQLRHPSACGRGSIDEGGRYPLAAAAALGGRCQPPPSRRRSRCARRQRCRLTVPCRRHHYGGHQPRAGGVRSTVPPAYDRSPRTRALPCLSPSNHVVAARVEQRRGAGP